MEVDNINDITENSNKNRPPTPNNSWTRQKEEKSREYQEDFEMYRYLHNQVVSSNNILNQVLSIPSILITAITSVSLFATLGIENQTPVIIVVGILNIITLFLQGVNEFYDPKTIAHKHQNIAKEYTILYNDIDEQLTQEPMERENGRDFIKKVRTRSNDLIKNAPTIPNRIWDKYLLSISKGEIINKMNRHMFMPQDPRDTRDKNYNNNQSSRNKNFDIQHNKNNQSSEHTIIPLSVMDENNDDLPIRRTYSETNEGSKETLKQVDRFINKKGNKNEMNKRLNYYFGRI